MPPTAEPIEPKTIMTRPMASRIPSAPSLNAKPPESISSAKKSSVTARPLPTVTPALRAPRRTGPTRSVSNLNIASLPSGFFLTGLFGGWLMVLLLRGVRCCDERFGEGSVNTMRPRCALWSRSKGTATSRSLHSQDPNAGLGIARERRDARRLASGLLSAGKRAKSDGPSLALWCEFGLLEEITLKNKLAKCEGLASLHRIAE
ncbi:MAG: hypothetical protein COW42_15245 [Deltaproteobacteria bacterium CG17_big_fil_post_rev_8_21_14_2_50_63_7]|nr:MAG: hypothetical protein COW42_15245 [Deltaproteobacteria bacterium CG17_big_fil_post_rev_8_21_14_2_50_63_7]